MDISLIKIVHCPGDNMNMGFNRKWVFPESRLKFQKEEEVSQKVKETFLNYYEANIDVVSRELYTGLGTPDLG